MSLELSPLVAVTAYHYLFSIPLSLVAVFLSLVVLVQRGRGGGLTGALGGMGGQSAFGTKAGDLFTRITIVVAAFWILLSMASLKFLSEQGETGGLKRNPTSTTAPATDDTKSGDDKAAGETGAGETPAADKTGATTPAAETPAAETPATETPAAEKPAETPAAEKPAEAPAAEKPAAEVPAAQPAAAPPAEAPAAEKPAEDKPADK